MSQSKKEKRRIAQQRVVAAWLALDGHTDLATLTKMIEVARAGRRLRKMEQRKLTPKQ